MGFSFETLQKVLTFAHTFAEIAQLVEHQLPKLRAAGSNPVFRSSKYNGRGHRNSDAFFFMHCNSRKFTSRGVKMHEKRKSSKAARILFHNICLIAPLRRGGRECRRPNPASHRGSRKPNPVRASIPEATPAPQQVPAIHRGHAPSPEGPAARGTAHDGTNLLHLGHTPLLQPSPAKGTAHGELQEPTNAINLLRKFLLLYYI